MIIKIPDDANLSAIYRWLESNVGLYGHGWKIIYHDPRPNSHLGSKYNDLHFDKVEDALAYKIVFGVHD